MEIRMEGLGSEPGYPLPGSLTPTVAQRQALELFCPPRPVRGWHDMIRWRRAVGTTCLSVVEPVEDLAGFDGMERFVSAVWGLGLGMSNRGARVRWCARC